MPDSPTSRSLAWCRAQGYDAAVCEKWNPHAHIRQDLFGVLDLIALDGERIIGVQATTAAHRAERRDKVEQAKFLPRWYAAGAVVEVWSWLKGGPQGTRKTWSLMRERLSLPNNWKEIEDEEERNARVDPA